MDEEYDELDKNILRYVGSLPPREIAAKTGHTAEEVLRRKDQLLDDIDVLSVQQRILKLTVSLDRIAIDAETAAAGASDEFKAGLYSASVGAIKEQLKQVRLIQKENDGAVEELNQKRVLEILRLFDVIVARGVKQVALTHDLDEDSLLEVFQSHIVEAAREVEG